MDAEHAPGSPDWRREAERIGQLIARHGIHWRQRYHDYMLAVQAGDLAASVALLEESLASMRHTLLLLHERSAALQALRASPADSSAARDGTGISQGLDDLIARTQRRLQTMDSLSQAERRTAAAEMRVLAEYARAWAERRGDEGSGIGPDPS